MPEEDQTSSGFNLPHKKGTALLRRGKLPAIDCPVTEITKIGCACRILWKTVESGKVQAWKMVLAPGVSLDLTLTAPPYLLSVPLTGRVQHLEKSTEGHQDVVIHFSNLDAEIASRLRAAVDALSTPEKQKSAAKVLERNEPAVTSNLRSTRLIRLAGQCKGKSIEDLLVVFKKITPAQLEEAKEEARTTKQSLSLCLIRMGFVNALELCGIWSLQSGLPALPAGALKLCQKPSQHFGYERMQQFQCMPFGESDEAVSVAVAHPPSDETTQALKEAYQKEILFHLAPLNDLHDVLFEAASQNQLARRRLPRFRKELPLVFQLCDGLGVSLQHQIGNGHTLDISEGGMAIEGPAESKSPEEILKQRPWCRITFWHPPHKIQAFCRICHIQRGSKQARNADNYVYGVQIAEITPPHLKILKAICEELATAAYESAENKAIKLSKNGGEHPPN